MESMNKGHQDQAKNYDSRTDRHIAVTKYRCEGLTMEVVLKHALRDQVKNMPILAGRAKITELEEERDNEFGVRTFHFKLKSPPLVSDRTFITTHYYYINDDGGFGLYQTAVGNEALQNDKYKKLIGSDVIA